MQRREIFRLIGGALAAPVVAGLSPGELLALGRAIHAEAASSPLRRVLDAHQARTVALLSDRIIPDTDTPGARAAGVEAFIDLILADWYSDEERQRFQAGLADLDERSRARAGVAFADTPEAVQTALMEELDGEVEAIRTAGLDTNRPQDHFFRMLKWLTLYGYYTSEIGLMQEVRWMPIPGGYDPCRAFTPRSVGGA